jgi:cell division control protein 11
MEDIEHYDIPVYNFPYDVEEDDEDTIEDNSELRVRIAYFLVNHFPYDIFQALMPFAIIGSEDEIEVDGQLVRARIYPWGVAEVDNPKHSDFSRLRSALLKFVAFPWPGFAISDTLFIYSSHLMDLKVKRRTVSIYACY